MLIKRMILYSCVFILILLTFAIIDIDKYWVVNDSMSPKIEDGETICALKINNNLITRHLPVLRNQIYLFNIELDGKLKILIKRCAAKSGDSVFFNKFEKNELYVNHQNTKSELTKRDPNRNFTRTDLRKSQLFFIGDNNKASVDSRDFGPIESSQLVGLYLWNCKK